MRVLGILALVALLLGGFLVAGLPGALPAWFDTADRWLLVATGATISAVTVFILARFRLGRLVKAAERIAEGDYTIAVKTGGGGLERRLAGAINRIAEVMADSHDRATMDRLTGVFNRQALLAELFTEVERASRYERPLCVGFIDIDHFKVVNDSYGHESGDLVLRGVAKIIADNLRASDLIGRYGGEEFMLILTETNVEEGAVLAEKLRTLVEGAQFAVHGNPTLSVTISIGIVGGVGQQLRMEALVRDADAAMYSAKELGRNQTYVFAEPDEDARVPRAPISAAGRARAVEIGRQARQAATDYLIAVTATFPDTRGQPSALISSIVVTMAQALQLPDAEVERIRVAALLHDVGKVAVASQMLDKPSELTSAEWRSVIQHPRIGQVILEQASALRDAAPIILHHHERYGGHGYPFGLRADEIPLGARIVAIADAYNAMIHDRPYKRAVSHEAALNELRQHAGAQFDPDLVTLFCDLFASAAPVPDPDVLRMTRPNAPGERRTHDEGAAARRPAALPALPALPVLTTSSDGIPAPRTAVELEPTGQPAHSSRGGKGRAAG